MVVKNQLRVRSIINLGLIAISGSVSSRLEKQSNKSAEATLDWLIRLGGPS
jgi:hypothetical protein